MLWFKDAFIKKEKRIKIEKGTFIRRVCASLPVGSANPARMTHDIPITFWLCHQDFLGNIATFPGMIFEAYAHVQIAFFTVITIRWQGFTQD